MSFSSPTAFCTLLLCRSASLPSSLLWQVTFFLFCRPSWPDRASRSRISDCLHWLLAFFRSLRSFLKKVRPVALRGVVHRPARFCPTGLLDYRSFNTPSLKRTANVNGIQGGKFLSGYIITIDRTRAPEPAEFGRRSAHSEQLDAAFADLLKARPDALFVTAEPLTRKHLACINMKLQEARQHQ